MRQITELNVSIQMGPSEYNVNGGNCTAQRKVMRAGLPLTGDGITVLVYVTNYGRISTRPVNYVERYRRKVASHITPAMPSVPCQGDNVSRCIDQGLVPVWKIVVPLVRAAGCVSFLRGDNRDVGSQRIVANNPVLYSEEIAAIDRIKRTAVRRSGGGYEELLTVPGLPASSR